MRLLLSIAVVIMICITSHAALADASASLTPASGAADLKQCIDYVLSGKFPQAIKGLQGLLAKPSPDVAEMEVRAWLIDAHLGNGDTASAMSELQSLEKQYPAYAGEVHHLVARRYFDQGKYPEAIAEFKISVEMNKLPKEHEHVKDLHRRLMLSYIAVGDMTNAYSELHILMNDFSDRVYEFVAAEASRWGAKYPGAIAELKKTAEALPKNDPKSRILRGELARCHVDNRSDEAASILDALGQDYPEYASEYGRLASLCRSCVLDYDMLGRALGKIVADPKKPASDKDLVADSLTIALRARDWQGAITLCKELLCDRPDEANRWQLALILAYLDSRQYQECITVCKEIISRDLDPDSAVDAMTKLAECMYLLGKGPEALAFQREFYAKRSDRKQEADWVAARTAYYAQRDLITSAALLEKFIADYPNTPWASDAQPLLANALQVSGQTDKAVAALDVLFRDAAVEDRPSLVMRKADVYSAKAYMRRVSEKYPDTEIAKKARGMLYVWDTYGAQGKTQ